MKNKQNINPITVMIAEDEPLLLQSLCNKIRELDGDFEITATADNGEDMYNILEKQPPDVLFSDIEMPICNGIELFTRVKSKFPDVITVIITSYDRFEYAQAAVKLQVKDYLLKPVAKEELGKILDSIKTDVSNRQLSENRHITELVESSTNSISQVVEILHRYIKENYTKEINLAELSEKFHYNELHLSRSFKQIIGCTPSKLINELRMEDAKKILKYNKNITVSEISEKLGFSSPMYFNRVFKFHTGKTPGEFRDS